MNLFVAVIVAAQPWRERRGLVERASASTCALAALVLVLTLGSFLLVVSIPALWPVPHCWPWSRSHGGRGGTGATAKRR